MNEERNSDLPTEKIYDIGNYAPIFVSEGALADGVYDREQELDKLIAEVEKKQRATAQLKDLIHERNLIVFNEELDSE